MLRRGSEGHVRICLRDLSLYCFHVPEHLKVSGGGVECTLYVVNVTQPGRVCLRFIFGMLKHMSADQDISQTRGQGFAREDKSMSPSSFETGRLGARLRYGLLTHFEIRARTSDAMSSIYIPSFCRSWMNEGGPRIDDFGQRWRSAHHQPKSWRWRHNDGFMMLPHGSHNQRARDR